MEIGKLWSKSLWQTEIICLPDLWSLFLWIYFGVGVQVRIRDEQYDWPSQSTRGKRSQIPYTGFKEKVSFFRKALRNHQD